MATTTEPDPKDGEAVRETVVEWLQLQADRVESGEYLRDLDEAENGEGPYLSLDEEGVRDLSRKFLRICLLAIWDENDPQDLRRRLFRKIENMADAAIKDLEERTGLTLYNERIHHEEHPWVDEVKAELAAEIEEDDSGEGEVA